MTNILNAESALLASGAKFKRWHQKDEAEWIMPIAQGMWRALLDSMPDEVKDKMKEMDKESYDFFVEMVGGE